METNEETLDRFLDTGMIDIARGPIFDKVPERFPGGVDFDRAKAMMLTLAIGDSLGVTSEGMNPDERRMIFKKEIRDYVRNRHAPDDRGYPSDDTQLSFWTLECINEDGGLVPERVAGRFCRGDRIFGIGGTVKEFIGNFKNGVPWYQAGPKSAGNGALMRIAPVIMPHLKDASPTLWADAALCAMMTHNDSASIASCLAFVYILWELMHMDNPPSPTWWVDTFVEVAHDLEVDAYRPRVKTYSSYKGPLWQFTQERLLDAYEKDLSTLDACQDWHSGAFIMETVPSALYILMRHADDLEEAVVRAVNDTRDNDTIAAVVGAAVGALHGTDAIPERWKKGLSGCTRLDEKGRWDDGRVFTLLEETRELWG